MNGALYGYNRSNTSSFDAVVQSLQMITYDYLYAKEADKAKPVTEWPPSAILALHRYYKIYIKKKTEQNIWYRFSIGNSA